MSSRRSSSRISKLPARARRLQWALHRAMAEPLEPRRLLSAELVKDINQVPTSWDSEPTPPVAVGDIVFFTHRDTDQRRELWKTDGTEAGTVMLRDFQQGWPFRSISDLTASNGLLFFVADDSVHGKELWKSDGTASGTVMVRDIFPGIRSGQVKNLADVNGTLFFSASNGVDGEELWKSDGTEAGTVMVRNINPGSQWSSPRDLANIGGALFFVANNGVAGFELWKSNGTSSGTMMVRDIWSGNTDGLMNGYDPEFTDVNGTLFFVANNGLNGRELWRSNGTSSGTVMVRDIRPDVYGYDDAPRSLTNVNGTLFFTANDTVNGPELWKTDGTTAGTVMVRDIRTGSLGSLPRSLVNVNGTLFFSADHLSTANELWKSDGSAAGTVLVRDIRVGGSSTPMWLTDLNGTLFFAADNGVHGYELWKSDGTAAGTVMVRDIQAGSLSGIENFGLNHFLAVNQTLFFRANDSVVGKELWKTDGTTAGTMVVRDVWPGTSSSSPREIVDVNGTAFFRADDGIRGSELWKSDGTAAGTVLVKDIYVATGTTNSSSPRGLTNANGTLFFFAYTVSTGVELWRSDGTAAGTVLVRDVRPGQSSAYDTSAGHWIVAVGSTVFFAADDGISGSTLWKSDGTAAGTVPVRDVALGNSPSSPKDWRIII